MKPYDCAAALSLAALWTAVEQTAHQSTYGRTYTWHGHARWPGGIGAGVGGFVPACTHARTHACTRTRAHAHMYVYVRTHMRCLCHTLTTYAILVLAFNAIGLSAHHVAVTRRWIL